MKLLMCRPTYYEVVYEINPWMSKTIQVAHDRAMQQWENLYQTLIHCGAEIALVAPVAGLPDMVFTANAGLKLAEKKIMLANFKYPERQGEVKYFRDWFQQQGYDIVYDAEQIVGAGCFEGAGDALFVGDKLFAGFGFRTAKTFYEIQNVLPQYKLVYCELVNPYFYHIDTCFCPLNTTQALWYPAAFSDNAQKNMQANAELFAVPEEEARRFACNAVVIDKNIVVPSGCPQTTAILEEIGFSVYACDMDEYLKAGGACKCLTLQIG